MTTFSELGLDDQIVSALSDLNITIPTEIQQEAIPYLIKSETDFIGLAQTGTGKTAAFGLPLLNNIDEDKQYCQAIILAPTRELAQQIASSINTFAKNKRKIKVDVVFGGAAIINQIKALKSNPQIVVATPGRLIDLIKRKSIDVSKLSYLVLDEADEMLNMGFKEELNKILEHTPKEKNTWLFSATMPKAIKHIVSSYMYNPHEISVKSGVEVNKNIKHQYMLTKMSDKLEVIKRFLDMESELFGVLFCRTKMDTQNLADQLSRSGYAAEALHGDLTQKQRDVVMRKFKDKAIKLLVATDVAARGIDVSDLTHVIHHKLPDELEFYTHRSGRTARAGKKGVSIVLVSKGEKRKLDILERQLGISFERAMVPTGEEIVTKRVGAWLDKMAQFEIKKEVPEELKAQAISSLEALSKEDLVERLLAIELDKIKFSETQDLNAPDNGRSEGRGDRGGRGDNRRQKAGSRLEINIGKIDSMSKGELLDMVVDLGKLSKEDVGQIDIQQKRSYLEIEGDKIPAIIEAFSGVSFDGREVKLKKAEGGGGSSGGGYSSRNNSNSRGGGYRDRDSSKGRSRPRPKRR